MDNDLPAISALRDEESPPPADSTALTRFRIKLPKRSNPIPDHIGTNEGLGQPKDDSSQARARSPYAAPDFESVHNEEEVEEDQLIDDDDLAAEPPSISTPNRPTQATTKPPPAKKQRVKRGKGKEKDAVFMVSTFELTPAPPTQATTTDDSWAPIQTCVPPVEAKSAKRKTQVKKEKPSLGRPRKTRVTQSSAMQAHYRDDDGSSITSEAVPNTVASSPQPFDTEIGESEHIPIVNEPPPAYLDHDITVDPEHEPIPVWPLPTRVFPVQNLPKIPTGNAPAQPPEKKTPPVRQWRQAQREIRGIAGGRWFVRSWIGGKDSEYATWKTSGNAPSVITTTTTTKKLKFLKPDTGERSVASATTTPILVPEISVVKQA